MTTSPTVNVIYLNNYKPDYKPNYQHLIAKYHGNNMVTTVVKTFVVMLVVGVVVIYLNDNTNEWQNIMGHPKCYAKLDITSRVVFRHVTLEI